MITRQIAGLKYHAHVKSIIITDLFDLDVAFNIKRRQLNQFKNQ